ncbi:MAG TPA: PhoH family protein, partial [Flavobacteriales bacterium]|nr:PhoH family protein [Flavobacteriales bacterium]
HVRGRTFNDCFVIIDEAQNMTVRKMRTIVTRIGRGSRMVLTGDPSHVDLRDDEPSGLNHLIQLVEHAGIAAIHCFDDSRIVRNSVAAHLEPEILVIDEVLAVGDAEFQRKCLGKMKDVAHHGRTILFVSHNMTAIASLCSRVIWLHDGRVRMDGPTSDVVRAYLGTYASHSNERRWVVGQDAPGNDLVRLTGVSIEPDATTDGEELLDVNTSFKIRIHYHNSGITDDDMNVTIQLYNAEDIMVFTSGWRQFGPHTGRVASGAGSVWCAIPAQLLNTGNHRIVVNFFRNGKMMFQVEETIGFEVHEGERTGSWYGRLQGVVRPRLQWGTN